jgi:hypothetical protein
MMVFGAANLVTLCDQIRSDQTGTPEKQEGGRKPERTQSCELLLAGRIALYATVTRRSNPRFGLDLCFVAACAGASANRQDLPGSLIVSIGTTAILNLFILCREIKSEG